MKWIYQNLNLLVNGSCIFDWFNYSNSNYLKKNLIYYHGQNLFDGWIIAIFKVGKNNLDSWREKINYNSRPIENFFWSTNIDLYYLKYQEKNETILKELYYFSD